MRVGVQNEFELKIYLLLTFAALLSLCCRSNDDFIDINTTAAAANEKENEEMKMKINCYFMDGERRRKNCYYFWVLLMLCVFRYVVAVLKLYW